MTYGWNGKSTYVQNPPYFQTIARDAKPITDIVSARILGLFGDKITTDHISPAGSIKAASPAGEYLLDHGVQPVDFNQYGTRRGNHEVMMRGTFANIRIKNHMVKDANGNVKEGGLTIHYPSGKEMPIYDAAMLYEKEGVPLVVFAGIEYGNGSSRDWAAKGTNSAWRPRRHRAIVRAYPPFESRRHGRGAVYLHRGSLLAIARPQGRRAG